jgi:hypothetical protein
MARRPTSDNSCPAPYDYLLYLLLELEQLVERGGIVWSDAQSKLIRNRLATITAKVPAQGNAGIDLD